MQNDRKDDIKQAAKNDWEQTKADMPGMEGRDIDQDVDDTIRQAMGKDDADRAARR